VVNSLIAIAGTRRPPEPEAALLICCATSVATPERTARARAIVGGGVNWTRAVRLASLQAVLPLVNGYLTSELEDALPAVAMDALRQAFFGNSLRNLHLARELARLVALLERGGVEALAFKGPALAIAAYGSVTMRQYTDLDLLVRRSEAARAAEILGRERYAPCAGYGLADLERPGAFETSMARPDALPEVDLHWQLIPPHLPFALDGEDLWRRAMRVDVGGVAVRSVGRPRCRRRFAIARLEFAE